MIVRVSFAVTLVFQLCSLSATANAQSFAAGSMGARGAASAALRDTNVERARASCKASVRPASASHHSACLVTYGVSEAAESLVSLARVFSQRRLHRRHV